MPCTQLAGFQYHDDVRFGAPFEFDGDHLRIRFSEGVLEAVGRRIAES